MSDIHTLRALVGEVEAALDQVPQPDQFYTGSWIDAHERCRDELRRLVIDPLRRDRDLSVAPRGDQTTVRLAGITATSTGGAAAALRNWITAARRKIDRDA